MGPAAAAKHKPDDQRRDGHRYGQEADQEVIGVDEQTVTGMEVVDEQVLEPAAERVPGFEQFPRIIVKRTFKGGTGADIWKVK
jgi:hypothetical protein